MQLESILYNKEPLSILMRSAREGCDIPADAKLTEEDWSVIEEGVKLLKPFMLFQQSLEGDKYVTGSLAIPLIHDLRVGLTTVVSDGTSTGDDSSTGHILSGVGERLLGVFCDKFGDGSKVYKYSEGNRRQPRGFQPNQVM
jgi:hypothetical protein